MSGTRAWTRFRVPSVAVRVRPATPLARDPRVGRLLGSLVRVTLIAALALAVFIGAGIVGNPWYRMITIEGGSMAPAISRGDLIMVTPAPSKIEPGMILVMTIGGEVVTHRVVAVNADGTFVTRGDANRVNDNWGGQQAIVTGQYLATVPVLGRFLPVGTASEASFADGASAGMQITVGPFPAPVAPPTPPECTGMTFAEVIVGTDGNDTIQAGNGGALIFGLGGDDTIYGGNGKDCLVGGPGDDTLAGGNGKDVLLGGDGNDAISGGGEGDVLDGGNGKDLVDGGDGIDACYGTDKDTLINCETGSTDGSGAAAVAPAAAPSRSRPRRLRPR